LEVNRVRGRLRISILLIRLNLETSDMKAVTTPPYLLQENFPEIKSRRSFADGCKLCRKVDPSSGNAPSHGPLFDTWKQATSYWDTELGLFEFCGCWPA
jgi:hypothetical protein